MNSHHHLNLLFEHGHLNLLSLARSLNLTLPKHLINCYQPYQLTFYSSGSCSLTRKSWPANPIWMEWEEAADDVPSRLWEQRSSPCSFSLLIIILGKTPGEVVAGGEKTKKRRTLCHWRPPDLSASGRMSYWECICVFAPFEEAKNRQKVKVRDGRVEKCLFLWVIRRIALIGCIALLVSEREQKEPPITASGLLGVWQVG